MILRESVLYLGIMEGNMASRAMKMHRQKAASSLNTQPDTIEIVEAAAVAARAYELWQERGCPIGSPEVDWFQAEDELKTRMTGQA